MALVRSIVFLLFVAVTVLLAQKPKLSPQPLQSLERLPIRPLQTVDENSIQYEMRKPGEEEGDATRDVEFDDEIASDNNSPSKLPTVDEARRVYSSQIDRVAKEAAKAGDETLNRRSRVSLNPVFQYYSLEAWQKPVLKCCPRSWNYQCRSSNVRLPCFSHYTGGVREWCCPIWPSVFIKRCMCSQCAVLTPTCAHEGRCQRRYSKRSFLAVCYRNNQWGLLRYITRYLPSSCYCRI